MIVYRIGIGRYSLDLSGAGASRSRSNRWNSYGTKMVYTSAHRSLCLNEILVRFGSSTNTPIETMMLSIEIPDDLKILELSDSDYPIGWDKITPDEATRNLGDNFVFNVEFPVMKVKSVIVKDEYNYLINPRHSDSKKVKVLHTTPFKIDPRLGISI